MAQKHLLNRPHRITNDFWWYEENKGIVTCALAYDKSGAQRTFVHDIPWRSIRAALYRKDRK